MSKELFNYLFDSNDNVHLEPESISIQHDLPQIPAPICSHLCIRHRLLRLNYHIASPHQSQMALCKKHLHTHLQITNDGKCFSISKNKNVGSISNINRLLKTMTDNNNNNNDCKWTTMRTKKSVPTAQLLTQSFGNSFLYDEIYQSILNQLYLHRSSSSILVNCGSDRRKEP